MLLREMETFRLLLLWSAWSANKEFCTELTSLNKASVPGAELRRDFMVCGRLSSGTAVSVHVDVNSAEPEIGREYVQTQTDGQAGMRDTDRATTQSSVHHAD